MFKVDVLSKDCEAAYEHFLEERKASSVQHSLAWSNIICNLGKDEPYFVVAKEKDKIIGALPLYFYKCPLGNLLTTTSYYTISGIICSGKGRGHQMYRALLDYSVNLGKELDCTAISIGTNPFLDDKELCLQYFPPDYVMENFIQHIKLGDLFDEEGRIMHPDYTRSSDILRNLKKAQRRRITVSEEQSQSNVDNWYEIHKKRMRELDAAPIPKELFNSIRLNLVPENKGKFLFAFYEGKMISGGAFIFNRKKMDAFMISMDSDYAQVGANYLMIYDLLKWANKHGILVFNWMSSPKRGDGVYKWKEKWGSSERNFLYLTKVLGDISQWKEMDYHELKNTYNFHYLLPYNLLKNPGLKVTNKDTLTSFMRGSNGSINS